MANTYTYDDFLKALEQSGYGNQFSQADLNLARQNPDAGMSLLSYKTDYANATTDEARALANQGAESVRSSYGGYTGGGDGGSFKLNPMSPNQFSYGEAPTFEDNWADRIDQALNNSMNRGEYSYYGEAPVYESRYDPRIQETLTGILDRGEFSYDPKTDPVYSAYQKQYAREGQRATANAMGEAAAMTGGQLSSWAMTAANQAGDYYASQMADKIPELYQDAYNRYLQEYQMKLSDLNALRGLESDDYAKYQDQLAQYNTDRQFDYGTWLDRQKLAQQDVDTLRALRADDLDLYKTNLSQYNTNREFDYGQWLDEISDQRTKREDERDWAKTMAEYEDFSKLNSMGVNTEKAELNANLARAMQAAEMGDYSQLAALGVDTSNAALMQQLDQAYKQAQISSIYANMPTEEERALANALKQAQIASTYAGIQTDAERELANAYKQAQIDSLYKNAGGTGGSTTANPTNGILSDEEWEYFNSLTANGKSTFAKYANSQGDPRYNAVLGINPQEAGGDDMVINSVNDLTGAEGPFAAIREMHKKGDKRVDSQDKVKEMVWNIPGYDRDTMDDYLKDLLAELFGGKKENSTGSGSNSTKSGSNGTNVNARNRASIASV